MARTLRDPAIGSTEKYATHASLLCGACDEFAVMRESDGTEATYTCEHCGTTKTIAVRWEATCRAEALLILKETGKRGE